MEALPNTWVHKTQEVATRGIPDILACINGMFVALELKATENDKADPLQLYNLNKIVDSRGFACTVSPESWDRVFNVLQIMSEEGKNDRTQLRKN